MNATDIVLLVLGSFFIIRGLFKGFSGELFSLLAIVGGFYCALTYYTPLAGVITATFGITTFASSAFSMLFIFLLIFAACFALEKVLKKILNKTSLSWLDKFFGGVAGFAKIYLVALLLLVMGMVLSPVTGDAWVCESKTLIATAKTWPFVYPALDRMGILPDLAEIQREAKEYIVKQASRSIFGTNTAAATPSAPQASDDVTPQNGLLDFFLSWGQEPIPQPAENK